MAYVVQQNQTTSLGTGTTIAQAYSSAVVAGNTLWCAVSTNDAAGASITVSDSVNGSWTALDLADDTVGHQAIRHFYFPNAAAGTPTVTATFSLTSTLRTIWITEITGVKGAPLDGNNGQVQASPGSGTDAISSGTATNANSPAFIISLSMDNRTVSPVAPAAGTGFTDLGAGWTLSGGNQARLESKRITSQTAVAGTFTGTTGVAPITVMAIFDELSTGWQQSSEPPKTYNKRLQWGCAPAIAAVAVFVAASFGFCPSTNSNSTQGKWQPTKAINEAKPVGQRITAPASSYLNNWADTPSVSGWQPQTFRSARFNHNEPIGSLIAPPVSSFVPTWSDPPAVSSWKVPLSKQPNIEINSPGSSIVAATIIPPTIYGARLPISIYQSEPSFPYSGSQIFPSFVTDLPTLQYDDSSEIIKVWNQSRPFLPDVFIGARIVPALGAIIQNDPVSIPKAKATRAANDNWVLTALSTPSTFSGWSSSVAPQTSNKSQIPAPDLFLDTLDSPFVDWSPALRNAALQPTRIATDTVLGSPFPFAPNPSFTGWVSELISGKVKPNKAQDSQSFGALGVPFLPANEIAAPQKLKATGVAEPSFIGTAFPFAPSPIFSGWVSEIAAGKIKSNSTYDPQVFSKLGNNFLPANDNVSTQKLGTTRLADAPFSLAPLAQPPGVFEFWSSEPPQVWKQPYSRPDNAPISSDVTLPPFATFQQWSIESVRGTFVKSRPPGEAVLTGQFIPPPVLTGIPWDNSVSVSRPGAKTSPLSADVPFNQLLGGFNDWSSYAPKVTQARSSYLSNEFPFDVVGLGSFVEWSPVNQKAFYQKNLITDPFIGTPLVTVQLSAFQHWAPDAVRSTLKAIQPVPEIFIGTLIPVSGLSAFQNWSQEPVRISQKYSNSNQDSFFGIQAGISSFQQWSVEQNKVTTSSVRQIQDAFIGSSFGPTGLPWASRDLPRSGQLRSPITDQNFFGYSALNVLAPFFDQDPVRHAQLPARQPQENGFHFQPKIIVLSPFTIWATELPRINPAPDYYHQLFGNRATDVNVPGTHFPFAPTFFPAPFTRQSYVLDTVSGRFSLIIDASDDRK